MSKPDLPAHGASITVGELITELCRLPDHATVRFHCESTSGTLRFGGVKPLSPRAVEIELDLASETPPIAPA